ncbi:co-chaperone GroES [Candidatus Woesebacteria bacterium CG_4_10_14_0_2_um_filter_44_9]|uniref:Co-chaperonin GroES n=2 Tax=Candidatus Woeseibacteriota TaxID=1752722 RepID=A0A2H0BH94_9BACT|nr:MAG: co-chaperone GroES [Candidatus Woesebacteria bacterium CG22_combo_CG10-13_8_21_14_all_45_10]PIZ46290.1 MAG: co-chaperone GroES [Candidatus Woesebacteria bacterium CG_4_10_14_0_2_um_filter_44_9]
MPHKIINLKPTAGYVIIKPLEAETKTSSGIYLPDSAGEKPQKGKVLAVGAPELTEKGTKKNSPCKVGDKVIYKKWGGNEVKIGNIEYLFVKFEDVLAVEA